MQRLQPTPDHRVRAIFVSDLHLGCRAADAEGFLHFIESYQAASIYIAGDFLDGWRLRRRWHWQPVYTQILRRLIELAESGAQIYYTPGNHDEFLRHFLYDFGLVQIADEFVHQACDGRRYLVTHGDKFDAIEAKAGWLSRLGTWCDDVLAWLHRGVDRCRAACGLSPSQWSAAVKGRVKQAVRLVSDVELGLVRHAESRHCDGVICGHLHTPTLAWRGETIYANAGDWVENSTAIVEHWDGRLELIHTRPRLGNQPTSPGLASIEPRSPRLTPAKLAPVPAAAGRIRARLATGET